MEEQTQKIDKEKTKQFVMKLGWLLFIITIALIIGFLLYPKIVDGMNWPLNKTQTCIFFNISGQACDQYWCDNFLSCNWSVNDSFCICRNIINNTIYVNITQNITINGTNYSNLSSVDYQFLFELFKNYTDNQIRLLRDSLVDRIENETRPIYYGNDNNKSKEGIAGLPYWFIFGVIIMLVGLVGFLSWTNKKNKEEDDEMPQLSKKIVNLPKVKDLIKKDRIEIKKSKEEDIEEIGNEYEGFTGGDEHG